MRRELEETAELFLTLRGQAIKPLTPAEVSDLRARSICAEGALALSPRKRREIVLR